MLWGCFPAPPWLSACSLLGRAVQPYRVCVGNPQRGVFSSAANTDLIHPLKLPNLFFHH